MYCGSSFILVFVSLSVDGSAKSYDKERDQPNGPVHAAPAGVRAVSRHSQHVRAHSMRTKNQKKMIKVT